MKLEKCCMCGIAPIIEVENAKQRIKCERCGMKTSDHIMSEMAAKEWNGMMKQSHEIIQKKIDQSMPKILKERIYAAEEIIAKESVLEERRKRREEKKKKEMEAQEIPVVKGKEITGKQYEAERVEEQPKKRGRKAVKDGK